MGTPIWETLLAKRDESTVAPWTGGRSLRANGRLFDIQGRLPIEYGWHEFSVSGGRKATWKNCVEVDTATFFRKLQQGYLVGDRLLPDGASYTPDPAKILGQSLPVFLVEPGLNRFTRVSVGRHENGALIYVRPEFPLGPEPDVQVAYLDRLLSVSHIPGVTPALDLAFRFETWLRDQVGVRRRLLEEQRRREEETRALEARRKDLVRRLGDGASRREMAHIDFEAAARAALAVGGAELLDWRGSHRRGEKVVQFRFRNRRFECVCDDTLHIIDAGICLQGGDHLFTLESLPGVIAEAQDTGVLHIFRHVDGEHDDGED